jgi:hypothetical protein
MSSVWAVHISDVHFGDRVSGGGLFGGNVPKASGHNLNALKMLSVFLQKFIATHRDDTKVLIVSGDVTALGHPNEFAVYRTMMELGLVIDANLVLPPLASGFDHVVELPGNHDYWDGIPLNPFVSPAARSTFFPTPSKPPVVRIDTNNQLAFHTLCSTSGADPSEQFLAVGAYEQADVDALRAEMHAIARKTLSTYHFVVTHHTPSHGTPLLHGIADRARGKLTTLCRDVHGILTGHAHKKNVEGRKALPPEVRSASTLQASVPQGAAQNGFFVHRFEVMGRRLAWEAIDHAFTNGRFLPTKRYLIT